MLRIKNLDLKFRDLYLCSKEPACLDPLDLIPGIIIYSCTAQKFYLPQLDSSMKHYSIIFHGRIYGTQRNLRPFWAIYTYYFSECSSFSIEIDFVKSSLLQLVSNVKSYWWSILSLINFKLSLQNKNNQLKKVYRADPGFPTEMPT